MDPNATLNEIRRIINRDKPDDNERLRELIDALDGWCSTKGFLPKAWER